MWQHLEAKSRTNTNICRTSNVFTITPDGSNFVFKTNSGDFLQVNNEGRVVVGPEPSAKDLARFQIFNKDSNLLVPATSPKRVFIQNVGHTGFLSHRDFADQFATDGELWVRNQKGKPTAPLSWEAFEVTIAGLLSDFISSSHRWGAEEVR